MAAGRAETAGAASGLAQLLDLVELGSGYGRGDDLRDPLAAPDRERLVAMVNHDDLHFSAIIAVDRARRVGHGDAMLQRQPRPRPDLDFVTVGDGDLEAGGDRMPLAGLKIEILGRDHVHPGGTRRGIARQGQAFAVGQSSQTDADGHSSSSAMRAIKWRAMSCLAASGQSSTPSAVIRWTRLCVPPITLPDTSLATIQSAFLALRLAMAWSTTFSVSAAKPTSRRGRRSLTASSARMSR